MLYRIILNYFRLKLVRLILARFVAHRNSPGQLKTMSFITYFLELFVTHHLNKKTRK
jgi:hypothetical protein